MRRHAPPRASRIGLQAVRPSRVWSAIARPPLPRPDFLRPVRGPSVWAWGLAAAAALCLLAAVQQGLQAWKDLQGAQASRQTAARLLTTARAGGGTADAAGGANAPIQGGTAMRAAATAARAASADAERALADARQRLARPWHEVFISVESVDLPGLSWTALESGEDGRLRLEGVVPDGATALLVAERLRRAAPWREATVGRMARTATPGELRIEVTATAAPPGAAR